MDQERFEEIDRVLEAALKIEPEARDDFLKQACAGDDELRREVELLLSQGEEAEKLEVPAIAYIAEELAGRTNAVFAGQRIGHYLIKERIGAGGMGEVWKAWDEPLKRDVAIKILPLEFSADPDRVRRFKQEALTVSALNHPNIITIHEVGQSGPIHFIATEYVDGQTLRERLSGERLSVPAALDIAVQVASALAAAHEAGIVHRDIKPENIMLRRDGYVKTLDFGLAKLRQREGETGRQGDWEKGGQGDWEKGGQGDWEKGGQGDGEMAELESSGLHLAPSPRPLVSLSPPPLVSLSPRLPVSPSLTNPGAVMGTVRYMSPEQARGMQVDHRADLFSLGVVLYEMTANCALFEGATNTEVLASILKKEPSRLRQLLPEAPEELEMILSRALRKERAERYQSAREMLDDLKRLKQELDLKVFVERAAPGGEPPTRGSPSGALRARIRSPQSAALIALAFVIAVTGLIAWGWYRLIGNRQIPAKTMKMTRLTDLGTVRAAAISPDGRYVAYSAYEAGRHSLWVREVATTDSVQLLPPADGEDHLRKTFSPDGREIFYVKYEEDRDLRTLYRVSALGGTASKVLEHVDSSIAFSPDGAQFAFVRYDRERKESSLIVARTGGGEERKLVTRRDPELLAFTLPRVASSGRLAWSPDGEVIAYAVGTVSAKNDHQIWVVPAKGGAERLLFPQKWWDIHEVAWLGDGSGLLLLAVDEQFAPNQIWLLPFSGGEALRLANDPDGYANLSVTADARTLATARYVEAISIWVAPAANPRDATRIHNRKTDGRWGLAWTTDGKILYDSKASGRQEIWIMDANGANQRRLTSGSAADDAPAVSPDGRYIIYASRGAVNDITHIWRMDRDGRNPKQLTFGKGEYEALCSPDSRWVVYTSRYDGNTSLWKTTIDGGDPARMTADDTENPSPAISPDGKLLAYYRGLGNERKQIEIIPFDGGAPVKIIKVPETAYLLKWAPDGRALTYANTVGGVTNVWRRPLNGDPPTQLTFFKSDTMELFDWSRDGAWLVCARRANYEDVILINDFK